MGHIWVMGVDDLLSTLMNTFIRTKKIKKKKNKKEQHKNSNIQPNLHIQCKSKKVAPLKLFAIFSLKLSIFP